MHTWSTCNYYNFIMSMRKQTKVTLMHAQEGIIIFCFSTYYVGLVALEHVKVIHIRASVDALCRDGAGQISRERVMQGLRSPLRATIYASKIHRQRPTGLSIAKAVSYRLMRTFVSPNKQNFVARDFRIFRHHLLLYLLLLQSQT